LPPVECCRGTRPSHAANFSEPRRRVASPTLKNDLRFGRRTQLVKRPLKRPDRVYPLGKNQEYACHDDWEDRPG
jgi:hypothetical protein